MLNAKQLIEELSELNPETIIYWSDWDSEFDITHVYVIDKVASNGGLIADYSKSHPDGDKVVRELQEEEDQKWQG